MFPSPVRILITTLLYMSLMSPVYFVKTLCLPKVHHISFLVSASYVQDKFNILHGYAFMCGLFIIHVVIDLKINLALKVCNYLTLTISHKA